MPSSDITVRIIGGGGAKVVTDRASGKVHAIWPKRFSWIRPLGGESGVGRGNQLGRSAHEEAAADVEDVARLRRHHLLRAGSRTGGATGDSCSVPGSCTRTTAFASGPGRSDTASAHPSARAGFGQEPGTTSMCAPRCRGSRSASTPSLTGSSSPVSTVWAMRAAMRHPTVSMRNRRENSSASTIGASASSPPSRSSCRVSKYEAVRRFRSASRKRTGPR